MNRHAHNEAYTNSHATYPHSYQRRFSANVWVGIIHDHLFGPYLLLRRLGGSTYLVFLQEVLPVLLPSVPANIKAGMRFQHDGAPAHFSSDVRNALDTAYSGRWIGRRGPKNWPARSSDFLYASSVDSDEDLVARIAVVASDIQEMPILFANVRSSLRGVRPAS